MGTTGVLLLNTTLTVREHAANSHAKLGWSTLTDYVIERCCQLPQRLSFWHGAALPSRWSRASSSQLTRARQPTSSVWPPRTPRRFRPIVPRQNSPPLWGRVPSRQPIGYSNSTARPPSTGLASAKKSIHQKRARRLSIGRVSYSGQINCVRPASPPSINRLCPVINRLVTPTK